MTDVTISEEELAEFRRLQELQRVQVGSFFLETLTTGMYGEPFDCIREYIQNAFDAITDAIAAEMMGEDDGRIQIEVGADSASLHITDNGAGIPASDAERILIAIGASSKRPQRHAGFRGIGRLAGIAYCSTLRFTTSVVDEPSETIVEFDCSQLRGYIRAGASPMDLRKAIIDTVSTRSQPASANSHYTRVTLEGLIGEGTEFTSIEHLHKYLCQHAPTDYEGHFSQAAKIRQSCAAVGYRIPTVRLSLKDGFNELNVTKALKDSMPTAKSTAIIDDIRTVGDPSRGWYGWFGLSNFPGEITDERAAGLRFRVKNIQVGGPALFEDIALETSAPSDRRLLRWTAGEVFILDNGIVPNARRDGFEDTPQWRRVREELQAYIKEITQEIRKKSRNRVRLKTIRDRLKETTDEIETKTTAGGGISDDDASYFNDEINDELKKIEKAINAGADPEEARELISQIEEIREQIENNRKPTSRKRRSGGLAQILQIVEGILREKLRSRPKVAEIMEMIREKLAAEGF